ncbi:MAG: hypothetical protein SFT90_05665 [Rickettsiales bacterium]|nr:hypothetical protein [Rickettsiales bacterium]
MVQNLKTAEQVEAEIRELNSDLSHLLFQLNLNKNDFSLLIKIAEIKALLVKKQEEHREEVIQDAEYVKRLDTAESQRIETNFQFNISNLLSKHKNFLKTNIFTEEFNQSVFDPAKGNVNEQAMACINERAEKAEQALANFRNDQQEFTNFLTELENKIGKEKTLELLEIAFNQALGCQQVDFQTLKEYIEVREKTGELSSQEIYDYFAKTVLQFDENILPDLKQELEYQSAKIVKENTVAEISNEQLQCIMNECGVNYCGAELNTNQSRNFVNFCADRALDDNFSQNSGDECRQERLDFISKFNSDPEKFIEAIKPQILQMKKGGLDIYLEAIDPSVKDSAAIISACGNSKKMVCSEELNAAIQGINRASAPKEALEAMRFLDGINSPRLNFGSNNSLADEYTSKFVNNSVLFLQNAELLKNHNDMSFSDIAKKVEHKISNLMEKNSSFKQAAEKILNNDGLNVNRPNLIVNRG